MMSLLAESTKLRPAQWLILSGTLLAVATATDGVMGFLVLEAYTDRIFGISWLLILSGVALLFARYFAERKDNDDLAKIVHECNARQYTILDHHPRSFYETDHDGRVTFVNKAYVTQTGRAVSELEGAGWAITIHPKDRDRVMTEWTHAQKAQRRFESGYILVSSTGRESHVYNSAAPMTISGPPFGWTGQVKEIEDEFN